MFSVTYKIIHGRRNANDIANGESPEMYADPMHFNFETQAEKDAFVDEIRENVKKSVPFKNKECDVEIRGYAARHTTVYYCIL